MLRLHDFAHVKERGLKYHDQYCSIRSLTANAISLILAMLRGEVAISGSIPFRCCHSSTRLCYVTTALRNPPGNSEANDLRASIDLEQKRSWRASLSI